MKTIADHVDDGVLQVDKDGARDVPSSTGLEEDGVEGGFWVFSDLSI